MSYIGAPLVSTNFVLDQFTATAGQTAFTLTRAPASAQSVLVGIDGVVQEPGVAYTVSGTTLTMTSGVPLSSKVWVVHLGVRGTLTAPVDGSVTEDSLEATFAAQVRPQSAAAQATTSGTAIDFTGIPSWVKKITIMLAGFSANGTGDLIVEIGDSGGLEQTGYLGGVCLSSGSGNSIEMKTTAFQLGQMGAASTVHGVWTLALLDASTNTWCMSGTGVYSDSTQISKMAGSKSLSGTLTQLRLSASGDTFDAGKVNILYE